MRYEVRGTIYEVGLTDQNDYAKTRNYWKYLKAKLKKEKSEVVSATTQLKITAAIRH